ncbi:MAG: ABC transporter ATP-binding protein, partial [Oscillospiraceae bacterium]|nr:ABC transporter ATP-binding protein [Oscillospiraceae bacterium]
ILDELSRLATHYGFIDSGRIVKEMSARELEAACRKCLRVTVTDTRPLARALDQMGVDYKILEEGQADVFAQLNISQLSRALDAEGCELLSAQERDESLESYFVNLVGGDSRA